MTLIVPSTKDFFNTQNISILRTLASGKFKSRRYEQQASVCACLLLWVSTALIKVCLNKFF